MKYNERELDKQFDEYWKSLEENRIAAISLTEDNDGMAILTNEREVGLPLFDDQTDSIDDFEPLGYDVRMSMFEWLAENAEEVE